MPYIPVFKLRVLVSVVALSATGAYASDDEDFVVREYTFQLTDIEEIEFHASVGEFDIVPIPGNEVRLVLEIENDDHGWFDRGRDVSNVELESDVRGRRLRLEQTAKGTNTNWTVQMPAVARTSIKMGVGSIDAEFAGTELELDLGVGEVDVALPERSTGDIDISVGVGEASLRGATDVDREHAFVSQEVSGRGAGTLDVHIDVGVGDVTLTLE